MPQDDASTILGDEVRPEPGAQAGEMASPEFTLERMQETPVPSNAEPELTPPPATFGP